MNARSEAEQVTTYEKLIRRVRELSDTTLTDDEVIALLDRSWPMEPKGELMTDAEIEATVRAVAAELRRGKDPP